MVLVDYSFPRNLSVLAGMIHWFGERWSAIRSWESYSLVGVRETTTISAITRTCNAAHVSLCTTSLLRRHPNPLLFQRDNGAQPYNPLAVPSVRIDRGGLEIYWRGNRAEPHVMELSSENIPAHRIFYHFFSAASANIVAAARLLLVMRPTRQPAEVLLTQFHAASAQYYSSDAMRQSRSGFLYRFTVGHYTFLVPVCAMEYKISGMLCHDGC